ncbi:MAG: hypothetical protein KGH72_05865 [Candidatus Micrarchaeota archaeon]|nr:hypothetical protein [Candidatus Micrarchaeota archaeon]
MAVLDGTGLRGNGMRFKADPTKTPTEIGLALAGELRQAFSNHDAGMFRIMTPILNAQSRPARIFPAEETVTATINPFEVLLSEPPRPSSLEWMAGRSKAGLEALVRDRPIDVSGHRLAGSNGSIYMIAGFGFLDGGNHRTLFSCMQGIEGIPANVFTHALDDRPRQFIVGDTRAILEVLSKESVWYDEHSMLQHARNGHTNSVWSVSPVSSQWDVVTHMPADRDFAETVADLLVLRGATAVFIAD